MRSFIIKNDCHIRFGAPGSSSKINRVTSLAPVYNEEAARSCEHLDIEEDFEFESDRGCLSAASLKNSMPINRVTF